MSAILSRMIWVNKEDGLSWKLSYFYNSPIKSGPILCGQLTPCGGQEDPHKAGKEENLASKLRQRFDELIECRSSVGKDEGNSMQNKQLE